jgi:hypothetical protein
MFKMNLHDPFAHFKHKLWRKERSRIKLVIWFLTIKSQESPQFPCVKVTSWKALDKGYNFDFRPHFDRSSSHKVMRPQRHGSPRTKWHLGVVPWLGTKYTIRGKVMASPESKSWWVLWVCVCPWLVLAPKAFKLCPNQLVVWFVQVRVIN